MEIQELLRKAKNSGLVEITSGIMAGAGTGVLLNNYFAGNPVLEKISELPVWDAHILSDPILAAGTAAVVVGLTVAGEVYRLRTYLSRG